MLINLLPALAYVMISTFTPGPSNISTTSLAVLRGYRQTLSYQGGLAVAVFCVMLLSGWISTTVQAVFPQLESVLRYVGAAYILYLAYGLLKATYEFTDQPMKAVGFVHGFVFQLLNFKLVVYAFTLFSAFLAPISGSAGLLVIAALVLAAISFCATSLWATFGGTIKVFLRTPRTKAVVNILLALSLVVTAVSLTGLI